MDDILYFNHIRAKTVVVRIVLNCIMSISDDQLIIAATIRNTHSENAGQNLAEFSNCYTQVVSLYLSYQRDSLQKRRFLLNGCLLQRTLIESLPLRDDGFPIT